MIVGAEKYKNKTFVLTIIIRQIFCLVNTF